MLGDESQIFVVFVRRIKFGAYVGRDMLTLEKLFIHLSGLFPIQTISPSYFVNLRLLMRVCLHYRYVIAILLLAFGVCVIIITWCGLGPFLRLFTHIDSSDAHRYKLKSGIETDIGWFL